MTGHEEFKFLISTMFSMFRGMIAIMPCSSNTVFVDELVSKLKYHITIC